MLVPKIAFWKYQEFIDARWAQYQASLRNPSHDRYAIPPDGIFCDYCNFKIPNNGELINVVDFGRIVVCDPCYQRRWATERVTYKKMNPDGSLDKNEIEAEEDGPGAKKS
jgi:hypothetical protein